jgi:hypothetical protein
MGGAIACRNASLKARRALSPLVGESRRGGAGRSGDRTPDEGPISLLRKALLRNATPL